MVEIHKQPHNKSRNRSAFRACRTKKAFSAAGAIILGSCIVTILYTFFNLDNGDGGNSRTINLDNEEYFHSDQAKKNLIKNIDMLTNTEEKNENDEKEKDNPLVDKSFQVHKTHLKGSHKKRTRSEKLARERGGHLHIQRVRSEK
mmetsp:Transcript_4442/g.4207  ORF Transcript_4442/g.4207 Transcript_4442/m.4207 type:complete len:145 (-) Transcript_4442:4-438(-)